MSATDRKIRERCETSGKLKFPTRAQARKFARHASNTSQYPGARDAYECEACGCWHLTKSRTRDKR
jgi:hypothetical protein